MSAPGGGYYGADVTQMAVRMTDQWHRCSAQQTAQALGVELPSGLSSERAGQALARHGPNRLVEQRRRDLGSILLGQFSDFMILVLISAAVVSGLLGELTDSIAILVIILLNAVIGVVQEYRAERALEALKRLAVPSVTVRRDGRPVTLASEALVPGDVLLLEAGNLVPADVRLVEASALQADEAALTGESTPVAKQVEALADAGLGVADRSNMLFRGTLVTYGHGEGVVVATGMDTQIGHIADLLERGRRPETPLQRRLARFGKRLAILVLLICAIIFLGGLLRGVEPLLMFLTAVSLAVAAIPEALPAVVTIALAIGAHKLVRHHALIRQLPAVETLGSVTVICSDKTGTLTQNRMRVEAFVVDGVTRRSGDELRGQPADTLFAALALNNDSRFDDGDGVIGEPTEAALLQAVADSGRDARALRQAAPRVAELPFDASRKMMTTVHRSRSGLRTYTKGAPEAVAARCVRCMDATGRTDNDDEGFDRAALLRQAEGLAAEGYRVLAFACRDWQQLPDAPVGEGIETDLTFVGLVALLDPPRPEVREAVATCRAAGITPIMITGDHPVTARAIAERLGMARPGDRLLTGRELARLSDAELDAVIGDTPVYARVAPEQKIRIVNALQERGEFVAMTGDGVNDAPALRRADIGVAMGGIGTDVAREAAHMVLLDDNFATIVSAVREGRRIFDNIRKFIRYTMTSNAGEIWTLFLAPFLGLPIPLLPIQILWINLVTDGLPGLALSFEPHEPGLMRRPPRPPGESIFAHGMGWHMLWIGLLIGGLSVGAQAWAYHAGNDHWQTMVFNVLTFAQLFHVMAIRSERQSLWRIGVFSNRPLLGAVALTFGLQLLVTYIPFLQGVFNTQSLSLAELALCLAMASLVLPAVELEKWLIRGGRLYGAAAAH